MNQARDRAVLRLQVEKVRGRGGGFAHGALFGSFTELGDILLTLNNGAVLGARPVSAYFVSDFVPSSPPPSRRVRGSTYHSHANNAALSAVAAAVSELNM